MERSDCSEPWKDWLRANADRLILFSRQQTRSETDAQDVLQEAVLRVWSAHSQRSDLTPPALAEVFTAIRRCAIDLGRKEDRRSQREQRFIEQDVEPVVWFENRLESNDENRVIEDALRRVPEQFREVIMLRIWGELTFAEIGNTLDIPVNTAASRYRYGLEALKKQLNFSVL